MADKRILETKYFATNNNGQQLKNFRKKEYCAANNNEQ